ncbi:hypothetical protein NX059_002869 [Plenodomus lindquistii]|nr:hypothetical protein NX059_002869 [Plenodomus lindquistii]
MSTAQYGIVEVGLYKNDILHAVSFTSAKAKFSGNVGEASNPCGQRILQQAFSFTRAHGSDDSSSEDLSDSESAVTDDAITSETETSESTSNNSALSSRFDTEATAARTSLYLWWSQIVGDYSRRNLTYPSDKLVAISGLAKEFNTIHAGITGGHDQYLAGLWLGALADCLLWSPEVPHDMTCPKRYRAPSWPWARWNGATMPAARDSPNLESASNVVEYVAHHIALDNELNPYGGIEKATSLQVRGTTPPVRLAIKSSKIESSIGWDYCMHSTEDVKIGLVCLDGPLGMMGPVDAHIHAMQVKVQLKSDYGPLARLTGYSGLVLRGTGEDNAFERIGVFMLDEEHLNVFRLAEKHVITLV